MRLITASALATTTPTHVGAEVLLFLAVAASWAGVPAIGATALTAAAVAASQGQLELGVVLVVATVAGEVGGLIGYAIGGRWGRELVERPGPHHDGRERMLARGERVYARWGRLAVFVTPALISGTARMAYRQFVVWNFVASLGFTLSVGASAYGLGRVATGHHSRRDLAVLVVGLVVGAAVVIVERRRHHRPSGPESGT